MSKIATILLLGFIFSSTVQADGHGKHHRHHHEHEHHPEVVYVQESVPAPRYAAPSPRDQRSSQGLVGGLVGSAVGYEMGKGDPLAAGFGATAGAWVGNGLSR